MKIRCADFMMNIHSAGVERCTASMKGGRSIHKNEVIVVCTGNA